MFYTRWTVSFGGFRQSCFTGVRPRHKPPVPVLRLTHWLSVKYSLVSDRVVCVYTLCYGHKLWRRYMWAKFGIRFMSFHVFYIWSRLYIYLKPFSAVQGHIHVCPCLFTSLALQCSLLLASVQCLLLFKSAHVHSTVTFQLCYSSCGKTVSVKFQLQLSTLCQLRFKY